jgi:hypothetical protein
VTSCCSSLHLRTIQCVSVSSNACCFCWLKSIHPYKILSVDQLCNVHVYWKDQQASPCVRRKFISTSFCSENVCITQQAISGHHIRRWFNPLYLRISQLDGHYRQNVEHQLNRLWLWMWNTFDSGFVTILEFLHSHLLHWYRVNEALGSLWMPATLCVDSNLLLNKSDSHSYSCVVEKLKMTAMYAFAKRNNWTTYVVS